MNYGFWQLHFKATQFSSHTAATRELAADRACDVSYGKCSFLGKAKRAVYRGLIPFHLKVDTFGKQGDKEDKGEDLYLEFSEMVLHVRKWGSLVRTRTRLGTQINKMKVEGT